MTGIRRSPARLLGLLLLAGFLSSCGANGDGWFGGRDSQDYASNGERIYFTASNEAGSASTLRVDHMRE